MFFNHSRIKTKFCSGNERNNGVARLHFERFLNGIDEQIVIGVYREEENTVRPVTLNKLFVRKLFANSSYFKRTTIANLPSHQIVSHLRMANPPSGGMPAFTGSPPLFEIPGWHSINILPAKYA